MILLLTPSIRSVNYDIVIDSVVNYDIVIDSVVNYDIVIDSVCQIC